MKKAATDAGKSCRAVMQAFRRRHGGATAVDISAATALPLARVREILPRLADEFSGRLQVTESGEILYSFPRGFTSRYRGFQAAVKRFAGKLADGLAWFGSLVFKIWIMVMLIGYFVLFIALALASLFISIAVNSSGSDRRRGGGAHVNLGIFDLFFRLWFYSELTRPRRNYGREKKAAPSRPMHRAIFSFVFGEEEPGRGSSRAQEWTTTEKKAAIACVQANGGAISLPEFMALTGESVLDAEQSILSFCAEFGGSPEATEEGTIVYRFDALLKEASRSARPVGNLSAPIRPLKRFSGNSKTMNTWFGIINGVNLLFGSYYLYQAHTIGAVIPGENGEIALRLYDITYHLLTTLFQNPLPGIAAGLGVVPLAFSLLFWIIPGLRFFSMKKENEHIKMSNLRRIGFGKIWDEPLAVRSGDIEIPSDECRPANAGAARERVLKEMGAYSIPDVAIDGQGRTVYSFTELEREKAALEQYRAGLASSRTGIGNIVFDSE